MSVPRNYYRKRNGFIEMDPIGSIKLRWLHGALQDVTYELARSQFQFAPHTWEPEINAYRCESCIRICVDLAGVDRSQIDLIVEARRILVRGEIWAETRDVVDRSCGEESERCSYFRGNSDGVASLAKKLAGARRPICPS